MDVKTLSQQNVSEILNNAYAAVFSDENWNSIFPKVSGYEYFFPDNYYDMEEHYSVSSLMDGHFEDETKRYIFFKAIRDYLVKIGFDPSDEDYNESLAADFEKMVLKHISPRNFDFAKMMKVCYLSILNNPEQEIDQPKIRQK